MLNIKEIDTILKTNFENDNCKEPKDLYNPSSLKDIQKAAQRIITAVENKEKILLIGDYDADGITSTSIIVLFFRKYFPNAIFEWDIPDRFKHGYGVSPKILEEHQDIDLVFTVDNGIAAIEAAEYCKKQNIDLIITDHHLLKDDVPEAYAIVNPQQEDCHFPFKEICGAQVAWFLIKTIAKEANVPLGNKEFIEIVGIAIVSDVMPLVDMNRVMLQIALRSMNSSSLTFFKNIKNKIYGENFESEDIAFKIAPMLNATGRIKSAKLAVQAITEEDDLKSKEMIEILESINEERKHIERTITEEAENMVNPTDDVIVLYNDTWHEGVIGIVASKIVERFKKPTIILTDNEGLLKGSGRSLGNIHLFELLKEVDKSGVIERFGGHKAAAGVGILPENLDMFRNELNKVINEMYDRTDYFIASSSFGVLDTRYIGEILYSVIEQYKPFGERNPKPIFTGTFTVTTKTIMKDVHIRLQVIDDSGSVFNAIKFNAEKDFFNIGVGDKITFNYEISKNDFMNTTTYQLMIKELLEN